MKVWEIVEELQKHDPEMEVIITDGYKCNCYYTNGILIHEFEGKVDIGIGGCEENYGNVSK